MVEGILIVAVDDLIFLSKIQQTAKLLNIKIEVAHPTKLRDRAAQVSVRGVVLDLNHRSGAAVESLRGLKSDPLTSRIPVVGFVSHVQAELVAAARAAGCDQVLARSALTEQLPRLLENLAAGKFSAQG